MGKRQKNWGTRFTWPCAPTTSRPENFHLMTKASSDRQESPAAHFVCAVGLFCALNEVDRPSGLEDTRAVRIDSNIGSTRSARRHSVSFQYGYTNGLKGP